MSAIDNAVVTIDKLNALASKFAPGTPFVGLILSAASFIGRVVRDIKNRQQMGEDTADLEASVAAYTASLEALNLENLEYWTIPEKPGAYPAVSDPDIS